MTAIGLLALRLTAAISLIAHGSHQLFGAFAGPGVGVGGLSATAARFAALGLDPGYPLAVVAGGLQLLAGGLIAIGLLTRWASLAVIVYLVFVAWKDQLRWGFFLNWTLDPMRGQGVEHSVVLGGALLCLVLAGAGDFSIDGRRAKVAAARASGRARLRTRH